MFFVIGKQEYKVVEDYKNGFQEESIQERWTDCLDKYEYVVGDWGYEQLRLKGFYGSEGKGVANESNVKFIGEYLELYCNFNCAYFILRKSKEVKK